MDRPVRLPRQSAGRRLTLFQLLCSHEADRMLMSFTKAVEEERSEEARHKKEMKAIKKRKREAVEEFLEQNPGAADEGANVSATLSLYSEVVAINVDPKQQQQEENKKQEEEQEQEERLPKSPAIVDGSVIVIDA